MDKTQLVRREVVMPPCPSFEAAAAVFIGCRDIIHLSPSSGAIAVRFEVVVC